MKIYLAGPMSNIPFFNFPAFHAYQAQLEAQGHEVFSPARQTNEQYRADVSAGNANGDEAQAAKDHGFDRRKAMAADMVWICGEADAIAMMPRWAESKGATAEYHCAVAIGLKVIWLLELQP